MKRLKMTNFSMQHPLLVLFIALAISALFLAQFPKVTFDNDPENMLDENEAVRLNHKEIKKEFELYDFVIVGVVNTNHQDGIFNVDTLGRVDDLTKELLSLHKNKDGKPAVTLPARGERPAKEIAPQLTSDSAWERTLAAAFSQDPERLFTEEGESCIISREIISPSVVDNLRQAEFGRLAIEYLMEEPPATREEALRIRDDAMNNPLYKGTLVSEDGKALTVYIPIKEKTYSYNVANLIEKLTDDWPENDQVYITGQPVAQDTFGVEMLVQMASSAPMAGLAIFILLYLFFRRFSLIIAPMIVAMVSVICTMGLLIGLGYNVHIMSSMIAIFLMPIAVADSVHILSEFFDTYHRFGNKKDTVRHVIGHLFQPMLFTSLTTIAGFASLATTPIPPVRIFGLHIAFGVGLAWLLTMTLIPAYIMLFVPQKALANIQPHDEKTGKPGKLNGFLEWLGSFSYIHWKMIIVASVIVVAFSVVGISKIKVNDNPVKWFTESHRIRVADAVLNHHFGGTYTAYLALGADNPGQNSTCREKLPMLRNAVETRFGTILPEQTARMLAAIDEDVQLFDNASSADPLKCFVRLVDKARKIDAETVAGWNKLTDEIAYADPETLTFSSLTALIKATEGASEEQKNELLKKVRSQKEARGEALMDSALVVCDEYTALSFVEFIFAQQAELNAPLFKQPALLAWYQQLQDHVSSIEVVGKTSSIVDALEKANYELNYTRPPADASAEELAEYAERNNAFYAIPNSAAANGQVFIQLEGTKKTGSLFHLVRRDYNRANLWIQLKSGDNTDMANVIENIETWLVQNPPPAPMEKKWAGLTYINVEWQKKMVSGMMVSLLSSFVVVLIMMMLLFRSPLMGLLSMIPLSVTIIFIYGLIGWVGKDYDMPVAVLSALTLGLSVDFAIHFLQRAREEYRRLGSWQLAVREMFKEPAMAISRNAIVISVGFTPLLFAPLVPYKTVGFFLATIMAVSWLATLFILAALITGLQKRLFKQPAGEEE